MFTRLASKRGLTPIDGKVTGRRLAPVVMSLNPLQTMKGREATAKQHHHPMRRVRFLSGFRGCSRGIAVTMSIARLSADAGVKYLLKTTAHGDVPVRNLTDYYTKSGNPPGTWLGSGIDGIGLAPGTVLTDGSAKAVFEGSTASDHR
ncbi:relaxase domain-containing protein [Arthrobacter sp. KN11-1C]|uniref:relaxase domain-containing protein n=1 Tax=Arthrobacter sp. KN11-1C TaxID=3445774 RepID=UPI003FA01106